MSTGKNCLSEASKSTLSHVILDAADFGDHVRFTSKVSQLQLSAPDFNPCERRAVVVQYSATPGSLSLGRGG